MIHQTDRLGDQLRFLVEIDALKGVLRQTSIVGGARRENSAEHSWHLAVMAAVLAEHAPPGVELGRAIRMLLVHDVVEIDAGDAFCYDPAATLGKEEREQAAARRIFGVLPPEQGAEMHALWEEFEGVATPDARFANALDRLQPLLHNLHNAGGTWRAHSVTRAQVEARMQPIRDAMPEVWPFVEWAIDRAAAEGWVG